MCYYFSHHAIIKRMSYTKRQFSCHSERKSKNLIYTKRCFAYAQHDSNYKNSLLFGHVFDIFTNKKTEVIILRFYNH